MRSCENFYDIGYLYSNNLTQRFKFRKKLNSFINSENRNGNIPVIFSNDDTNHTGQTYVYFVDQRTYPFKCMNGYINSKMLSKFILRSDDPNKFGCKSFFHVSMLRRLDSTNIYVNKELSKVFYGRIYLFDTDKLPSVLTKKKYMTEDVFTRFQHILKICERRS